MSRSRRPSLGSYEELRAAKFRSENEIDKAIDLFSANANLKRYPFDIADGKTLIIPKEAIKYLRATGLKLTHTKVLSPDELSPEEYARFQREQV